MIFTDAELFANVETQGDYGIVQEHRKVKAIKAFVSYGSGSLYASNGLITQSITHTALTQDKTAKVGMWLKHDGVEYLIQSVNITNRLTILYLVHQGGVSDGE